jgi:hypothetical protein
MQIHKLIINGDGESITRVVYLGVLQKESRRDCVNTTRSAQCRRQHNIPTFRHGMGGVQCNNEENTAAYNFICSVKPALQSVTHTTTADTVSFLKLLKSAMKLRVKIMK